MKLALLHSWPRTLKSGVALQRRLAPRVVLQPVPPNVWIFAGVDAALSRDGVWVIAGIVVWDVHSQTVMEQRIARVACNFPYVPGLLSFREVPGTLAAWRKLKTTPEVVLCDAHGLAHPRRFGLACHLGLWLGLPTVGCAKSRLCGTYEEPPARRGGASPLMDNGEKVGVVLRTRDHVKPVFVSPGHLCDHASACRLTLAATTRYRLPEPTRLAHQLVTGCRWGGEE